jgi:branched-chain amino acid transport system permease protein
MGRLLGYTALAIAICWGLDRLLQMAVQGQWFGWLNDYTYRAFILVPLMFITLAVSLNLINGITGQFSLGHAGFYAVGAYLSAGFTVYFSSGWLQGVPTAFQGVAQGALIVLATLTGGLAAGLMGLLVGIPTLRLRGDYLAIATLGFGEIVRVLFENLEPFGAQRGFTGIPTWVGFGFFWYALLAVGCIAVCRNLLQSTHGLAFLSVREDEVAAEAMGVNTTYYKVAAFAIGAMFAGAAGALLAHREGSIYPVDFKMDLSIIVVTMVVLGGQGSITGSIVAGAGLKMLEEVLRLLPPVHLLGRELQPSDFRMLLFALVLILTMIFRPQGIFGHREIGWASTGRFRTCPSWLRLPKGERR